MKRIITLCLSFIILFLISFSVEAQYTKWEKDVTYNNIEFDKIRFIVKEKDTTYIEGYLSKKTIIDGYPCHKYIVFMKDWKLHQFRLAVDFKILGDKFPAETEVRFNKDITHCFFGRDTQIQGYCCSGNFEKWYSMGISTTFYSSGELRSFFPCKVVEINNIFCKSSPFGGVTLFKNGNLKACKLAKKQVINGKVYRKNTALIFNEAGEVVVSEHPSIIQ
ncbi:MAG: hypothetical protein HKO92_09530 [Flavobacteriaceae bacterium]|nr:hypothetical protein [Flavobacteriaceae bacterium]